MPGWSIAIAIGLSVTQPSDLHVRVPGRGDDAVFSRVRWGGRSFVPSPWYALRVAYRSVALDFTHYKIYAATQDVVHEDGRWHGAAVADDVRLDRRVEHLEVTHGVNALGVVALLANANGARVYGGIGPVVYLPHDEATVDGVSSESRYAFGGAGVIAFAGFGDPHHRFVEVKRDSGSITAGIAGGTATAALHTVHLALSP